MVADVISIAVTVIAIGVGAWSLWHELFSK